MKQMTYTTSTRKIAGKLTVPDALMIQPLMPSGEDQKEKGTMCS